MLLAIGRKTLIYLRKNKIFTSMNLLSCKQCAMYSEQRIHLPDDIPAKSFSLRAGWSHKICEHESSYCILLTPHILPPKSNIALVISSFS